MDRSYGLIINIDIGYANEKAENTNILFNKSILCLCYKHTYSSSIFSLRWSNYYRTLSDSVVIFLLLSSIIAIFIGKYSSLDRKLIFHAIPVSKHNKTVWYFIIVGYLLEFLYCRSIPIVSVVFNGMGNYRDFTGIPTFHVLLSTLSSFWGIYVFVQYQSNPDNKELKKYCGLAFIPHLLLLNRGALVHILLSDVFIYLIRKNIFH